MLSVKTRLLLAKPNIKLQLCCVLLLLLMLLLWLMLMLLLKLLMLLMLLHWLDSALFAGTTRVYSVLYGCVCTCLFVFLLFCYVGIEPWPGVAVCLRGCAAALCAH